jgi:hypothetical protein
LPHFDAAVKRAQEIEAGFGGVGEEMTRDFEHSSL